MNNLQDLLNLIEFFKDTKAVEKQLKLLQDENARLEANQKAAGIVGDINKALDDATYKQDIARKAIDEAKAEAAGIVDKSRTVYDAKFKAVQEREKVAEQTISDARAQLAAALAARTEITQVLEKQRAELADARAQVEQDQADVTARLAKLKSVME